MRLTILIISVAAAALLAIEAIGSAPSRNGTGSAGRSAGLKAARMLHVGSGSAGQEGARQVQRLARNAQHKLELMSGRVSQIEDRIEEDLSGNSTDGAGPDGPEPAAVSTGPIGASLSLEPTQSSAAEEQPGGDDGDKAAASNRSLSTKTSWSAPVIKSVIPESARRVPGPSEPGDDGAGERLEAVPGEEQPSPVSASAEEQPPATGSPRTTEPAELDLDAPPAAAVRPKPRFSSVSEAKAPHRVAAGGHGSLLGVSDWNPNQNHNYFMELNAKNHAASAVAASQPAVSHQASAKPAQGARVRLQQLADKFPNMTITSSESDLANSYSSSHLAQQAKVAVEPERRQSSSVKSFSPYRRQQQQQSEQLGSSLRPITWPALAGPMQPPAQSGYYSVAGEEQAVQAGQPMAPVQALGAPDHQAPAGARYAAHVANSSDLKHRSADGAEAYANGADSSSAYAGPSQPEQQDSSQRLYVQERNMYAQEAQPGQTLGPAQEPQLLTFGHHQPLPAGQRNDEQSSAQEEAQGSNQAGELELGRAGSGSSQQRSQQAAGAGHSYQEQPQAQQASDIIALLRQIQQQRLQQRQQQAASNPIARTYYATGAQPAPEQQPQYRRFSPDLLTAYLGGRQQLQQAQSSQETAAAASDLVPYTTSSHFQPVYSAGLAYDARNAAIYRAAMAAAAKANEQAGRQAAQVYLAAAAAAAQQQQQSMATAAAAAPSQPGNNYSQLYASGSAPAYYESAAKSADGPSEVTGHLQRMHNSNSNANQAQQAGSSYASSPYRRHSYLNGLFKPSASSRYYYAPQLLSPIGLAAPVYAAPAGYAPAAPATTADALSQLYVAATSPYAVHAAQYAPADPSHQYQQALAAAVAANGLHAHYMADPDMAESSLVASDGLPASYASPLGSEGAGAGDDSAGSSSSSSAAAAPSGGSGSNSAATGKGGKGGVGQWTNIAGLLLGILPFGILMASLLPAVTVAGRRKRELELGVRNFAELLKWRAPSRVLDALLGRAGADLANATFLMPGKLAASSDAPKASRRRSLDASTTTAPPTTTTTTTKRPQQAESAPRAETPADERSLSMGNDLSQSTAYTMLAEAVASTNGAGNGIGGGGGGQQQAANQTGGPSQAGGVKAKVRKALSALNSFIAAAQNNMKRRHRSGEPMEGQWSLPSLIKGRLDNMLNLTDSRRQLAAAVQQRLAAQHLVPQRAPGPAPGANASEHSAERRTGELAPDAGPAANSSARHHLEVCLNQFLCRLTVKLNKSLRHSAHLAAGSSNSSSPHGHLERLTKKYIHQLVEQIEAEHPSVSLSLFKRGPAAADKAQPTPLDSLYKSAMQNQCSLVYNCVELLQLERTLSKMKLKFT